MPAPITLLIDRNTRFAPQDRLQLEAAGQLDPALLYVWQPELRLTGGFGNARFGQGLFGVGRSLGFGRGAFGRGSLAQPATAAHFSWQSLHQAGDINVRVRSVDPIGNTGSWSPEITIPHRPAPDAPADATLENNHLNITRS